MFNLPMTGFEPRTSGIWTHIIQFINFEEMSISLKMFDNIDLSLIKPLDQRYFDNCHRILQRTIQSLND